MCWCNPQIKTPNCGSISCHPAGSAAVAKELTLLRRVAKAAQPDDCWCGTHPMDELRKALEALDDFTKGRDHVGQGNHPSNPCAGT